MLLTPQRARSPIWGGSGQVTGSSPALLAHTSQGCLAGCGQPSNEVLKKTQQAKVAGHLKIDALFGILLPYTRVFISYNQYSGVLRHFNIQGNMRKLSYLRQ